MKAIFQGFKYVFVELFGTEITLPKFEFEELFSIGETLAWILIMVLFTTGLILTLSWDGWYF